MLLRGERVDAAGRDARFSPQIPRFSFYSRPCNQSAGRSLNPVHRTFPGLGFSRDCWAKFCAVLHVVFRRHLRRLVRLTRTGSDQKPLKGRSAMEERDFSFWNIDIKRPELSSRRLKHIKVRFAYLPTQSSCWNRRALAQVGNYAESFECAIKSATYNRVPNNCTSYNLNFAFIRSKEKQLILVRVAVRLVWGRNAPRSQIYCITFIVYLFISYVHLTRPSVLLCEESRTSTVQVTRRFLVHHCQVGAIGPLSKALYPKL